jgi:Type I phosphodiesterase / nucleotide pyrophosphatase
VFTGSKLSPGSTGADSSPLIPRYDVTGLGAVLPGVALALGFDVHLPAVSLPVSLSPAARRVCVVLIDGLGQLLLTEQAKSAPFLASLLSTGTVLMAGCPSTTATSLGSFGTGLCPGRHGLVGYEVMDPDRGVLLNELKWDPATDPVSWQPYQTVFQILAECGVAVTQIGNPEFYGSGLTTAALRGGEFIGVKGLPARVDAAVGLLAGPGPALVYLYWGEVDGAGHVYGRRSAQWRRALRHVDRELARLARRLPTDTLLVITADHGMVDVPHANRLDLADHPALGAGVIVLGGEARFAQLYCGATTSGVEKATDQGGPESNAGLDSPVGSEDVRRIADRFIEAVGDRGWVRTRQEAITAGWFGAVDERVRNRIGDIVVAANGAFALVDSRTARPTVLRLIGQHGSLTADEQLVPLLVAEG